MSENVTLAGSTGSENVAVTEPETATPVAPDAGVVVVTVGGVVSAPAVVITASTQ